MVKRKLELVFINENGKWYPIDEVNREELAEGVEKISKEITKRLVLQKEQGKIYSASRIIQTNRLQTSALTPTIPTYDGETVF